MADRIKGITIVIGGDTTGLSKALSGVNKQISTTQSNLKNVERLLKMDEHHLYELFSAETDNESAGSAEYKYLQEHIPEYIK